MPHATPLNLHLHPQPHMDCGLLTSLTESLALLSLILALLFQGLELDTRGLQRSHRRHFPPGHSLAMSCVLGVIKYQHYDSEDT